MVLLSAVDGKIQHQQKNCFMSILPVTVGFSKLNVKFSGLITTMTWPQASTMSRGYGCDLIIVYLIKDIFK